MGLHEVKNMQTHKTDTLDKMAHASFRKIIKFDLFCIGLGVVMGIGIGAFVITNI